MTPETIALIIVLAMAGLVWWLRQRAASRPDRLLQGSQVLGGPLVTWYAEEVPNGHNWCLSASRMWADLVPMLCAAYGVERSRVLVETIHLEPRPFESRWHSDPVAGETRWPNNALAYIRVAVRDLSSQLVSPMTSHALAWELRNVVRQVRHPDAYPGGEFDARPGDNAADGVLSTYLRSQRSE
jgi:hypothetical protein